MKISNQSPRRGREGVALVLSIVVLTVLLTVTYAFFRISLGSDKRASGTFDDRRAFLLTDAGMNEAFEALREDGTGAIGQEAAPAYLGGGVFWVESQDLGNNQYALECNGLVGSGRAALAAVVEWDPSKAALFQTTLNSDETLTLNADVVLDSYDSSVGTYASQQVNSVTTARGTFAYANDNGDARSNQDVLFNSGSTVLGDAIPGPGYTANPAATGSYLSGSNTPATEEFNFTSINYPSLGASAGPFSVNANGTEKLTSGQYVFDSVTINKSGTLYVEGPAEILVGDFTGGKTANLVIDATAGPVTFYVKGNYSHISGFEASPAVDPLTGDPSPMAVAFMIEGSNDITFPSNTAIRGAYYAPNATVVFSAGSECWGAFASKKISMSNGMNFHFDEDLMNHWKSDNPAENGFEVMAWTETAFESGAVFHIGDRRDPLTILGVSKSDLPKPVDAWVAKP